MPITCLYQAPAEPSALARRAHSLLSTCSCTNLSLCSHATRPPTHATGLTREQVLAAVEKFEKDEELDKLLSDITGLSEMFNVLKEENIEARVRLSRDCLDSAFYRLSTVKHNLFVHYHSTLYCAFSLLYDALVHHSHCPST